MHYEKFADGSMKCIEDEIPFDLPDGWAWAFLSNIVYVLNGDRGQSYPAKSKLRSKGIPFVSASNIQDGVVSSDGLLCLSDSQYDALGAGKLLAGDIVYCIRGSLGKCGLFTMEKGAIASSLVIVRSLFDAPQITDYIFLYLNSALAAGEIKKYDNGSAQPNLAAKDFRYFLVPLPPQAEMQRINKQAREALVFVKRIQNNKDELHAAIAVAKSKILDLAIRGQLVPQDPNDEPASVLLERIRAEKEELIKQGKIKRGKKESVIFRGEDNSYYVRQDTHTESIDEQFIFVLPDNWEWCSLLNIAKIELGKTLDSVKNIGTNYPYLRSVNVRWNEVDLSDLKEMRFEPEELDRYTVRRNDLLICEGGDVGRSCVWTDEREILYQNALHRVRFYGGCNPFYFMYYMMYYESRGIIKALCKGVTIKHLTGNVLSLIPFALPPIEEQGRIVERLNQIFVLIDSIICD